ncbi:MAG: ornithine cyclodeaminase family protein [Vulcanimicrobiaceae bacterium]
MAGVDLATGLRYFGAKEMETLTPTPQRSCELAAQALRWLASGEIEAPPKFGVHPHDCNVHAMPAYCKPLDVIGVKWVADFPLNRVKGVPTVSAVIILNDGQTGIPYAIMDGNWLTGIRTAAMTAVSLAACSHGASTMALIGTGLQARTHLSIVSIALPSLHTVRVVGRTLDAAEKFVASNPVVSSRLNVQAFADIDEALHEADVVVTVTNEINNPILDPAMLHSGATVALVDNPAKEYATLRMADRIIVDDRAPFESAEGKQRFKRGIPRINAVIGHVLLGTERGRTEPDQLVVIANLGNAALDIVFADEIYKKAAGV